MSSNVQQQKPSGLKPPSKIGKVTNLAKPTTGTANRTNNSTATRPAANEPKKVDFDPYPTSPDLALAIFTIDDLPKKKKISDASIVLTENTDDFIIGDRVWVGGTKPGHIQYIGETQFAPGEWAGVVLDEAIGKNDGSVAGVRYFQCESKRGVFSRLTKLSKDPVQHLIEEEREAAESIMRANGNSSITNSPMLSSAPRLAKVSPTNSLTGAKKLGADHSPHGSMQNLASAIESGLKIGGRVMVHSATGTKTGVLRYLGSTDFAAGEWAGVELDNAVGKNDGSVGGKRYFDCQMKYGLFAPIHKISKASGSGPKKPSGISRPTTVSLGRRSGSHESLNSSISSTSSVARAARVRLGITSLMSQKTSPRSPVTPLTATHNALQEALKEKEQHIEQLLKERDMEREDVARAAHQVEEAEHRLISLRTEQQRQQEENERVIAKLREIAENAERQRKDNLHNLEEEKRKVEDLQFRMEEEIISKGDLERCARATRTATEADAEKIQQLNQSLLDERRRSERFEQESQKLFQAEESITRLAEELEQVRNKLNASESRTKMLESSKDEVGERALKTSTELQEKEAKLQELEMLLQANDKERNELKKTLKMTEDDLERTKQLQQKDQENIEVMTSKLKSFQTQAENLTKIVQSLQLSNSDFQRKLQATEEKYEQSSQQKTKLERDLEELLKSKGDSSAQFSKMNEQLREREKHCEELHSQLQTASQETALYQERLIQCQQQAESQMAAMKEKHEDEIKALKDELHGAELDLQRFQDRTTEINSQHEQDQDRLCARKDNEIMELKNKIQTRDGEIQQLNDQLGDIRTRSQTDLQQQDESRRNLEQQLREAKAGKEKLLRDKEELERNRDELKQKYEQLDSQKERQLQQQRNTEAAVREKDAKVSVLTAEVERLRSEFSNHRVELQRKLAETELEVQTMNEMHNQLEAQNQLIDKLQSRLNQSEQENEEYQATISKLNLLEIKNIELESTSANMRKELEDMKHKEKETEVLFESEKDSMHQLLETNQILLSQQERELERHQKELKTLRNQTTNASLTETLLHELESEKSKLQSQVVELQAALEESKEKAKAADSNTEVNEDDKDSQISFLNSVIVDMQKKNDDLQAHIQVLEAGPPKTDSDINLNGINSKVVLPRLFCDICDMFDLHDTEDCPRQASSESPPPTQHHGNRNQVRPYCDICEVFGHWTNQCNDDETF